eukprot:TCONS_00014644-protein
MGYIKESAMNCTEIVFTKTDTYRTIQIVVLTFFLSIVMLNNILAIYATQKSISTKYCIFAQLYNISYISNIMAAFSLYGGSLFITDYHGDAFGCRQLPLDRYFFLCFGMSNNVLVLLLNTYLRRKSLMDPLASCDVPRSKWKAVLKFLVPFFLVSLTLSAMNIVFQYEVQMNFYIGVAVGFYVPVMIVVIVLNIHLTYFLNESKKIAENINQQSSRNLMKARKILLMIVKLQSFYTFLWIILVILMHTIGVKNEINFVILEWLMRVVYGLSFVLEAKILIRRDKVVQKVLLKAFRKMSKFSRDVSSTISRSATRSSQSSKSKQKTEPSSIEIHMDPVVLGSTSS